MSSTNLPTYINITALMVIC